MKQLLTALILIGLVGSLSSFGNLADPERLGGAMATPGSCDRESSWRYCDDNDVLNGYWSWDGWIPGYVDWQTWFRPAPIYSIGAAVYYNPGLMDATAEWRGLSLSGYEGGVALMGCGDIGKDVWLKPPGGDWEGPYLVVDCARRGDIYGCVFHRREVVEVDYRTARRWGFLGKWRLDGVEVSKVNPHELVGATPTDYVSWWLDAARFTDRRRDRVIYWSPDEWDINGARMRFPVNPSGDPQEVAIEERGQYVIH